MRNDSQAVRILLVEDDSVIALVEKAALARHGYEATVATSGEQAVELIQSDASLQLVLMDIDLGPGLNGIEAAQRIVEVADLPIVFLTSHTEREMVEQVNQVVRYGYVIKTSGEFVLIQAIQMALQLFETQKQLQKSREEYRSVAQLVGDIIVRHDERGNWTFLNEAACEFWGMPEEELKTHHFLEFVHPEDREATLEAIDKMRTTLKPLHGVIKREQTPAGVRIIEWNRAPIIDDDGRFAGHQSTGRDITARKEAEERIERLLSEREFLLRHGQHRIKNDMQFIRSLLGLQAERMDSEQPRQALREAAGRLDVMAKVYERLYTFDLGSEISSRSLATEIITELKKQHRVHGLTVRTDIEDIPLSAPLATASGMIVDELYTNSCKYAFTDHPDPSLDITVERERHSNTACEKLRISVQDNGPGYPPPVLRLEDAGFGTLMIRALVEQHQGTLTLENRDGAVTTVLIPLADPDVSPASA